MGTAMSNDIKTGAQQLNSNGRNSSSSPSSGSVSNLSPSLTPFSDNDIRSLSARSRHKIGSNQTGSSRQSGEGASIQMSLYDSGNRNGTGNELISVHTVTSKAPAGCQNKLSMSDAAGGHTHDAMAGRADAMSAGSQANRGQGNGGNDSRCESAPWVVGKAPHGFRRDGGYGGKNGNNANQLTGGSASSAIKSRALDTSLGGQGSNGGCEAKAEKLSDEAPEQDLYRALDFLYDSPQLLDKQHPPVTVMDQMEADRLQSSLLYGEILYPGVRILLNSNHLHAAEATTLYDLGMGCGRLVSQAFLEYPNLQRVVGVELAYSRFFSASDAAAALAKAHGWPVFATVSDVNAASAASARLGDELDEMLALGQTDYRGLLVSSGLDPSAVGSASQFLPNLAKRIPCSECGCICYGQTIVDEANIVVTEEKGSEHSERKCCKSDVSDELSNGQPYEPIVELDDEICGCPAFEHLPSDVYYDNPKLLSHSDPSRGQESGQAQQRSRLTSGLYSEGARGELHRRLAVDRSFPDSKYAELVTAFAKYGFYPSKHLNALEVGYLTSLTLLAPCEDHFACNTLAPVGCPLVENKDSSITSGNHAMRPTIPGLPPGAVLTDAELQYHRQLQMQQMQQNQTHQTGGGASQPVVMVAHQITTSSQQPTSPQPPVPGASVSPGPVPETLAPYDPREIDVLGRRDAPFGSNAAALALTCSRYLTRQGNNALQAAAAAAAAASACSGGASSAQSDETMNSQGSNIPEATTHGAYINMQEDESDQASEAGSAAMDCPPSVMPGKDVYKSQTVLQGQAAKSASRTTTRSKRTTKAQQSCKCGCRCTVKTNSPIEALRRAVRAVSEIRRSSIVHPTSYSGSPEEFDPLNLTTGPCVNNHPSNSNELSTLTTHKFPPRVRCWIPGCRRYCRQLQLRRGNLFEATDSFQSDIVVVEVKIRPPLFFKLRSFLRCLKPGARLLTYEDLIEVFNGCSHESGKETEEIAMRQLATGQYIAALRAQIEDVRATLLEVEKARSLATVPHGCENNTPDLRSDAQMKDSDLNRMTDLLLRSEVQDEISSEDSDTNAEIPSLSTKRGSQKRHETSIQTIQGGSSEGKLRLSDVADARSKAMTPPVSLRQLLCKWMGFTGLVCYGTPPLPPHILELPMGSLVQMAATGRMFEMCGGIYNCLCCEHFRLTSLHYGVDPDKLNMHKLQTACACACHESLNSGESGKGGDDGRMTTQNCWSRLNLRAGRSKILRPLPALPPSLDAAALKPIGESIPCICCCSSCSSCGRGLFWAPDVIDHTSPAAAEMNRIISNCTSHAVESGNVLHPANPLRVLHSLSPTQSTMAVGQGSVSSTTLALLQPCHPVIHPILEVDVNSSINSNGVTNGTGSRVATLPPGVLTFSTLITTCRTAAEAPGIAASLCSRNQALPIDNTCKCPQDAPHTHVHHVLSLNGQCFQWQRQRLATATSLSVSPVAQPPLGSMQLPTPPPAQNSPHQGTAIVVPPGSSMSGSGSSNNNNTSANLSAAPTGAAGALPQHSSTSQYMHEAALALHPPDCCLRLHPVPAGTTPTCAFGCPASVAYPVPCLRLPFNTSADRVPTSWAPYLHHRFHMYQLKL